jgi:hypothetical protein
LRNRKKTNIDFLDQKKENLYNKKQLHLKQDQMVDKVQVIIREQHQALDKVLAVIKEQHQAHQILIKMLLKLLIVP